MPKRVKKRQKDCLFSSLCWFTHLIFVSMKETPSSSLDHCRRRVVRIRFPLFLPSSLCLVWTCILHNNRMLDFIFLSISWVFLLFPPERHPKSEKTMSMLYWKAFKAFSSDELKGSIFETEKNLEVVIVRPCLSVCVFLSLPRTIFVFLSFISKDDQVDGNGKENMKQQCKSKGKSIPLPTWAKQTIPRKIKQLFVCFLFLFFFLLYRRCRPIHFNDYLISRLFVRVLNKRNRFWHEMEVLLKNLLNQMSK